MNPCRVDTRRIVRACLALAALFSVLNIFFVRPTIDTYALMHYALLFVREGGLYDRWIQCNPPLAIIMFVPQALGAVWLHLPVGLALNAYTAGLCMISLSALHHALKAHGVDEDVKRLWLAAAAITLLVLPSCYSVFGDREHLLFVFALPWMIQMLLGLAPLPYTSVMAGIGFCIKPYNLLFFIALQLLGGPQNRSLRERLFSSSALIICGLGLLYAASVLLFFPAYLFKVVPLFSLTYSQVFLPLYSKAMNMVPIIAVEAVLMLGFIRPCRLRTTWSGFLVAGMAVYCCNAGWAYTLYLFYAPFVLFCFLLLGSTGQGTNKLSAFATELTAFCLSAFFMLQSVWSVTEHVRYTQQHGAEENYSFITPAFYKKLSAAAGEKFILLSTTFWSTNIDVLGGQPHSVFGYDCLWPLPWLYAHAQSSQSAYVRGAMTQPLLAALKENPDAVLIVDTSPLQLQMPEDSDLLAFFKKEETVRKALASYTLAETLDDCREAPDPTRKDSMCRFAVWRKPTP